MNFDVLNNLIGLCAKKGIRHAVLCPGSRSAPLTLAFIRNKKIKCLTFSDERSAAFIAMGIAQQTRIPTVLVCTSGSAAYNFAPAIAEAFFQQIPLVIFTADRPTEWIDQFDGQTIQQRDLYGRHVKKFYELPQEYAHPDAEWHANRIVNEAINLSLSPQKGPVHINAPFREPLYPGQRAALASKPIRSIQPADEPTATNEIASHIKELSGFKKILVVAGQNESDPRLNKALSQCNAACHWPVVGDILSNLHALPFFCGHSDTFLAQMSGQVKESLRPDLLITFGKSLIAKNLKLFLRKYKPHEHWHIQPAGEAADTFQSLTRLIASTPFQFFEDLQRFTAPKQEPRKDFQDAWLRHEKDAKNKIDSFFKVTRKGEFALVKQVMDALPVRCHLHLANSMSVRYANHIGLTPSQNEVTVFSNRGTSGIDGCSSTAVGHVLASRIPNVLITGDQAFFYDRNAFWHNYPLPNLFVVVLNNHGGLIFNLIDGPSGLPESEEFFITQQRLNAKSLAAEFGFAHLDSSRVVLKDFFKPNKNVKILEIESSQSVNKKIFEQFKISK